MSDCISVRVYVCMYAFYKAWESPPQLFLGALVVYEDSRERRLPIPVPVAALTDSDDYPGQACLDDRQYARVQGNPWAGVSALGFVDSRNNRKRKPCIEVMGNPASRS